MFLAGTEDQVSPAESARRMYEVQKIAAAYVELSNSNHYEMTHGPRRHTASIIKMFTCHLKDNKEACN